MSLSSDRVLTISADGPALSISDVMTEADVVIIGRGRSGHAVHWMPLIVRDEGLDVVRVIKAQYGASTIKIRGIGGTAGGVTMVYRESIESNSRTAMYCS